jgi:hypothetical protein
MRKFSDRNQRTKEINGLYQTWSHCQKQKGIKRNKFFSDFVFFLFSGKRHFLLRQLAERDDVTRFRCLKISEKIWLIYIFFRLFATMLGLRVLPSPILVFPPK